MDSGCQSVCLHSPILTRPFGSTSPINTSVPTWRDVDPLGISCHLTSVQVTLEGCPQAHLVHGYLF